MEETLDPEDWETMRALGHRMVDDMLEHMHGIGEEPAWRHAPEEVRKQFSKPLPKEPHPAEAVYEEFLDFVLPYPLGNTHPRFWGWVLGTGTVLGAFAELLTGAMNTNTGGGAYHSANYVEKQVIEWIKEALGYPKSAGGLLTSGCSMSNLTGLTTARNLKADYNLRLEGIRVDSGKMTLYASEEIHSSIQRAVELLGLGLAALRLVPVNDCFQIDLQALQEAIDQDRQAGCQPFCVVGAAGTTNTGAIDDLNAVADICQKENLWFHVDGAFGAWVALAPSAKHLVAGMERADSLALDLHKWMYMPYEIGCVLVRQEDDLQKAFSLTPAYLAHDKGTRGLTGADMPWYSDQGVQHSRGFRALKAWMSFKEHGIEKYGRLIEQNIAQAHYLAELIEDVEELELVAPVTINAVCFRYRAAELDELRLDKLNKAIEIELHEQGIAVPSVTTINGKTALHVVNTNHRSRREDFEVLVREVIRLGKELAK